MSNFIPAKQLEDYELRDIALMAVDDKKRFKSFKRALELTESNVLNMLKNLEHSPSYFRCQGVAQFLDELKLLFD